MSFEQSTPCSANSERIGLSTDNSNKVFLTSQTDALIESCLGGVFLYFVGWFRVGCGCLEFRRLVLTDYGEMVGLWCLAGLPFKPRGRDSREHVAAQMRVEPDFFVGAFDGGRLVGVAVMSSDLRRGWINRLAVDPEVRRRGVAKALVLECERVLRVHGLRLFCALIENSNVASKKLFRSCGYVEHEDITYFSKRESDDV
jgi:ribosomal protein S18 acetylase RimI-like enzyme